MFLSFFGALNRIIFGVYYFAILWMEGWHMTLKCQLTSFHLKMTIFNTWLLYHLFFTLIYGWFSATWDPRKTRSMRVPGNCRPCGDYLMLCCDCLVYVSSQGGLCLRSWHFLYWSKQHKRWKIIWFSGYSDILVFRVETLSICRVLHLN